MKLLPLGFRPALIDQHQFAGLPVRGHDDLVFFVGIVSEGAARRGNYCKRQKHHGLLYITQPLP